MGRRLLSSPDGRRHLKRLLVGPNVVYAKESRPPLIGYDARRHRPKKAISGAIGAFGAGELAKKVFARGPNEHGETEFNKITEAVQEL